VATSNDVIHSFWVPELNRKIDMIPGRTNSILLDTDQPGVYHGQCAEFCGLQHAHMDFEVIAEPSDEFDKWLHHMASPAGPPATGAARRGLQTFNSEGCDGCHAIRGTSAQGQVGPDLTHLATRSTISGFLPNDRRTLQQWIRDPQHYKPGVKMPGLGLTHRQVADIVTYLEGIG
jgi:cytochrome c oxidase subunit 2